jgi:hypothetical protein
MSRNTLANHRSRHVRASAGRMQQFVGGATVAASAGYFHFLRIFTLAMKWRTWVSANRLWELEQETPSRAI